MPKKIKAEETDLQPKEDTLDDVAEDAAEGASESGDSSDFSGVDVGAVLDQITSEYAYALPYMQPKWKTWVEQKKVYGNKTRKAEFVGDPLLFKTFSTVQSSIYDDRLDQEFKPAELGDTETAEAINALSQSDARVMEMPLLMLDITYYTLFHSRVVVDMSEFDRETYKTTVPMVIDPMTMLRDPKAVSINGYMGKKGVRFLGYQLSLTKYEIDTMQGWENESKLHLCQVVSTDIDAAGQEDKANDGSNASSADVQLVGENAEYKFLIWYTKHKGSWYRFYTDPKITVIFRALKLTRLPLVDFFINADPTKFDGMSVPDLIEDKQRHRAAVLNASLRQVKKSQNPSYLFDVNAVSQNDLLNAKWGAVIPTNGAPDGKVALLPHDQVSGDVQWILDYLDQSAQSATAATDLKQGVASDQKRTLGELNIISSNTDSRFSLTAKLFAYSFGRFWSMWYWNYKEYFAAQIDSKVVRIEGPNGSTFRKLTRDNIISLNDPDVYVESKTVAQAKRMNDYNIFSNVHAQSLKDPTYSSRNGLKKLARLSGLQKDEIDSLYRPTIDELEAREENQRIMDGFSKNADGSEFISIYQDHATHIETHGQLPEGKEKTAHIAAHKQAQVMLRSNPELNAQVMMAKNPENAPEQAMSQGSQGMSTSELSGGTVNQKIGA